MNSGIYRLTFSSGRFYIGKSIDIPTRWRQHEDKFYKGKAAVRMQSEYNQCGSPEKTVLLHCHADHIDIVETWLIDQFYQQCGNLMLNATYAEPIADVDRLKVNRDIGLLSLSTPDHCELICDLRAEVCELMETAARAEARVLEYKESGILVPQDILDQRQDLENFQAQCEELELECTDFAQANINLQAEVHRLKNRGWWSRLWNLY